MSYTMFIHPSWAVDLAAYAGDDFETLMCQSMLARGEIVALDEFVIRQSPPLPPLKVQPKSSDEQAYLRLARHYKGRK